MTTAIRNVRIFDGTQVHENKTVIIEGPTIASIRDGTFPAGATIIDGTDKTLLPGLIDAHVHTGPDHLRLALQFGVTTELELGGYKTAEMRRAIGEDDTSADLRYANAPLTPPGGHPTQLLKLLPPEHQPPPMPTVSSAAEARAFVQDRIEEGVDYVKFIIEDGTAEGEPGLPTLDNDTLLAGVEEAHRRGKMAIVHAMTLDSARQALEGGADGLSHLPIDGEITEELLALFKSKRPWITPCACLNASFMNVRAGIADDERVMSRLSPQWQAGLERTYSRYQGGDFPTQLASIKKLHDAGVDVLVGTDAAEPAPPMGGVVHGASVHHEMQLLVKAGLAPMDALKAATSLTAKRFDLSDRGRIEEGLRADLLLVDGDPTKNIADTLNIDKIWRRGKLLG